MVSRRLTASARQGKARRPLTLLTVGILLGLCGACGESSEKNPQSLSESQVASANTDPWEPFRITGDEVEAFGNFRSMKQKADVVAVGQIAPSGQPRTIQGSAPEDFVSYSVAKLRLDVVLAGTKPADELLVEFLGQEPVPGQRVLVFLRHKGGSETGKYRAVNSLGLWASTSRSQVDAPLAEKAPRDEGPFRDELRANNIQTLEDLITFVHRNR